MAQLHRIAALGVILCGLVLMSLAVGSSKGESQTLREKKLQQAEQQEILSEVMYTNEQCEISLKASADFGNQPAAPDLSSACDLVLSALEQACKDPTKREAIQTKIKEVRCAKGNARNLSLNDGTLRFEQSEPLEDDFDFVRGYLEGALP